MLKPLTKISRYGKLVEVARFEKPLIFGHRAHAFSRRQRSRSTLKIAPNIWRLKRRIRRFVAVLTDSCGAPAFATFTYAKQEYDIDAAVEHWRQFTRRMRVAFPDVAFVRVPERHKKQGVHFHAVIFGMPETLPCRMQKVGGYWRHACPWTRPCERKVRTLAKVWGLGYVDLQEVRIPESIGAYLAKYLTKGEPDWTMFGKHVGSCNVQFYKKIAAARSAGTYWELSSFSAPVAVEYALDDILPRSDLRRARTFPTKWLGDCRYDIYEIRDS